MQSTEQAAKVVRSIITGQPKIGVVLGSGLGAFADTLKHTKRIAYRDIPGFPVSTAVGHAGEVVAGIVETLAGEKIEAVVLSGRVHLYEGYSAKEVTSGVRLLRALGVERLVLTCAAGGLNLDYHEGALVLISDHINLQGANPLTGPNDDSLGPRFPDMTEAYALRLRREATEAARELGISLYEGVYAGLPGPSFETPAEIRFLKSIGADLVGMSTVAETIAANHLGMEVLGLACVTNLAAGLSSHKLTHGEVLDTTRKVSGTFLQLLSAIVPRLAR